MSDAMREVDGATGLTADSFRAVLEACRPVVLRGVVRDWSVVAAARESPERFRSYVAQFDAGRETEVFVAPQHVGGEYYYTEDLASFNFERRRMRFMDALQSIVASLATETRQSMYVGSVPIDQFLPGFSRQNSVAILPAAVSARMWVGHASKVAAHYDTFDNIACVVAGARRFTLFAPEHIARLRSTLEVLGGRVGVPTQATQVDDSPDAGLQHAHVEVHEEAGL